VNVLAKKKGSAAAHLDLSSRASVDIFRKAAKTFTDQAVQSKQKARDILISEGIYTKTGRLSKNYT
jgi:hypothetical protein